MSSAEDDPYAYVAKGPLKLKNAETISKKCVFIYLYLHE